MSILDKQLSKETSRNLSNLNQKDFIFKEGLNAIAYTYLNQENELCAIGYEGSRRKPNFHYKFKTDEQRTNYIEKFFTQIQEKEERKQKRKERLDKQKEEFVEKIQVGTLLNGSWGYGQTNRELFVVVEKPSKYSVVIQPAIKEIVDNDNYSDMAFDVKAIGVDENGPKLKKKITKYGISYNAWCNLTPANWDDKFYESHYY